MLLWCPLWKIKLEQNVEYGCTGCGYFQETDVLQGNITGYECTYLSNPWADSQLGGA